MKNTYSRVKINAILHPKRQNDAFWGRILNIYKMRTPIILIPTHPAYFFIFHFIFSTVLFHCFGQLYNDFFTFGKLY
jgi:hypothetical protein